VNRTVDSPELERLLNEIFVTSDLAEIFVRAFRWCQRSRDCVLLTHSLEKDTARSSKHYDKSYEPIREVLSADGMAAMDGTVLPDFVVDEVRAILRRRLDEAGKDDVFPIVLGLMDVIDQDLYPVIWDDFYQSRGRGEGAPVPIRCERPFPRPVPALGTSLPDPKVPRERGLIPDYLELEAYFSNLAVMPRRHPPEQPAALHPEPLCSSGTGRWRVGIVSVLTSDEDVEWREENRRFWATSLRESTKPMIEARLRWVLRRCQALRADLVLVPELNADDDLRNIVLEELAGWKPRDARSPHHPMVIMGRLHEPVGPGLYLNRPEVITRSGTLRWDYFKRFPAEWKDKREALCEDCPVVMAMDTPLGRIAVVICGDLLLDQVRDALIDLRVSVIVVLSMTSAGSITDFQASAAALTASTHALTLFCNSSVHLRWDGHEQTERRTLGFVHAHTRQGRPPVTEHLLNLETDATAAVYSLRYSSAEDGVVRKVFIREHRPGEGWVPVRSIPQVQKAAGSADAGDPTTPE
jgi:predicted amidohydrolase